MDCSTVSPPSGSKGWHEGSNEGALWSIPGRPNKKPEAWCRHQRGNHQSCCSTGAQRRGFVRCLAAGVTAAVTQSCQTASRTVCRGWEQRCLLQQLTVQLRIPPARLRRAQQERAKFSVNSGFCLALVCQNAHLETHCLRDQTSPWRGWHQLQIVVAVKRYSLAFIFSPRSK